ncbi:MAG: CRISPR-associated protein Csx19 [Candidatus Marinimicrobia bacterium]|nr:CRISPR-associated protein Csx19 [Candidatus Neomarinimicrobiota bacterium]
MSAYKLNQVLTRVSTGETRITESDSLKTLLGNKLKQKVIGLIFLDNAVVWIRWNGHEMTFSNDQKIIDTQHIQQMRIFNEDEELFLRRQSEGLFFWRHRVDGEGDAVDVIDAKQILLGERVDTQVDFTLYQESAGSAGWVPVGNGSQHLSLQVRNYINTENHIAGFMDTRFLGLNKVI